MVQANTYMPPGFIPTRMAIANIGAAIFGEDKDQKGRYRKAANWLRDALCDETLSGYFIDNSGDTVKRKSLYWSGPKASKELTSGSWRSDLPDMPDREVPILISEDELRVAFAAAKLGAV